MYYKVLKDGKVIDVLDHLTFVKYQKKHDVMLLCDESEAQAIVSSDGTYYWHIDWLYKIPIGGYETVEIQEIGQYEYEQLRILCLKTPEEIIDTFVLSLLKDNII